MQCSQFFLFTNSEEDSEKYSIRMTNLELRTDKERVN